MKFLPPAFSGLLLAIFASTCIPITASAVITTWSASDDLYASKSDNIVISEGSNRLLVGANLGYLRFLTGSAYSNLDDIQSATLRIFLPYSGQNPQTPAPYIVKNILDLADDWNDDGSNPAVGAFFAPSLGTQLSSTIVNGATNPGIYFEWDVTSLVKSSNAGLGNNIMSFRIETTSGTTRFAGSDHSSGFYPQLVVTTVPEPSVWALLGLSFTVLVAFRRRLRKASPRL